MNWVAEKKDFSNKHNYDISDIKNSLTKVTTDDYNDDDSDDESCDNYDDCFAFWGEVFAGIQFNMRLLLRSNTFILLLRSLQNMAIKWNKKDIRFPIEEQT